MNTRIIAALFVLLITIPGYIASARGPKGNCQAWENIPNLTSDQQTKITGLQNNHRAAMLPLRNELNELKARQQTLETDKNADMGKINTNIDKQSEVKTAMTKEQAKFRQDIRNILTDEQRIWFDSRPCKGQAGEHKHRGGGYNNSGNGAGQRSQCNGAGRPQP